MKFDYGHIIIVCLEETAIIAIFYQFRDWAMFSFDLTLCFWTVFVLSKQEGHDDSVLKDYSQQKSLTCIYHPRVYLYGQPNVTGPKLSPV